jgi:hypothetical protein
MPSLSADRFKLALDRARLLRTTATDKRIRPVSTAYVQSYYHASLAALVAGWNAYCVGIVHEFFDLISDPMRIDYNVLHENLSELSNRAISRFNTPNWENSRNLLLEYTGYDPFPDWVWRTRGMTSQDVQAKFNEILKVRHSFAHGFSIPSYPWTISSTGHARLTKAAVMSCEALFIHLVRQTDTGVAAHIRLHFSVTVPW